MSNSLTSAQRPDDDDPRVSAADREVLHAAATGEGCVEITTGEQFKALCEAARATKHAFDDEFTQMTAAQAAFCRSLRVEKDYTWRAVAETCALEWGGDWGSNQLAGMAICERAATCTGEHYMREPWN